jgi:hypothetical protein
MGAIMRQITYRVLLIATWICSTASVIWVLNFGDFKWMLVAGACFASFISSVALAEELVEWQRHRFGAYVMRRMWGVAYATGATGSPKSS